MAGGRRALAATATLTRPSPSLTRQVPRLRPQLPLVEDTSSAEHWVLTNHAIERAEERGIGIMEIYSALAEPQSIRQRTNYGTADYVRGDLRISVNTKEHAILTVVDVEEDVRTVPRQPLNPLYSRKATNMPRKTGGTLDDAWALVPHSEPDIRLIHITPALAEKLLALNTHNRPLRKALTAQYVAEIQSGNWRVTHQGVALDVTPALQDGQHRLSAIVETGKGQDMYVAVGMPVDNFSVVDTGANRKYSDVLALSGFSDAFNLGACARLVYLYLNKDFASTYKVNNTTVLETVSEDPDGFTTALHWGARCAYGFFLTKSAAAAGFYLIARVNLKTPVNEFFTDLVEGTGMSTGDPRLVLRRWSTNSYKEAGRRSGPEQLALLLKCWNAWCEGRELRNLAWKKAEPMPRVTRFERKR